MLAVAIATGAHLSLTALRGFEAQEKAAKPLTTQFVKREPRLTKPLELRKRPRPKQRRVQREMVAVKARISRGQAVRGLRPGEVLRGLARLSAQMTRSLGFGEKALEPRAVAQVIHGVKDIEQAVDMSLEMMDVQALDTGQYQAMVIQDPTDKRSISGYFHFWMPWPLNLSNNSYHDWPNRVKYGIRRMVLKMSEWTGIKADVRGIIGFDSEELLKTPWVVLSYAFKVYPTDAELENMCRHMNTGGFMYTEGDPEASDQCSVIRRALGFGGYEESKEWTWERLPHAHGIFHCYYDFPDGPPIGGASIAYALWPQSTATPDPPAIQAIELGGRIAAITNNAGYVGAWSDWGKECLPSMRGSEYSPFDPKRQLEFGVNTIIFALTQEGSITHRLMESVR